MALPHDWIGEDTQAIDALKQAVLSGIPREQLSEFTYPFYSPKVGKEARRMAKMLQGLSEAQWARLMGVMKPALHPIGHAASPDADHCTKQNRDALGTVLRLYYLDALADRTTDSRKGAAVGLALHDRMLSQLELGDALAWLNFERLDLHMLLELRYQRGWSNEKISQALHIGRGGVNDKIDAGLDYIIRRIWR